VFWPPAIFLVACVVISIIDFDGFLDITKKANRLLLTRMDWAFTTASFGALILIICVGISPLGRKRIGGENATPILSRWNWFSITLCTTIATGILFWGTAEPIFHYSQPPDFAGVAPLSDGAARFAIASTFLHWTLTPYALYSVTTLAFALSFYNFNQPYSFSAPLSVLIGRYTAHKPGRVGSILDMFALMALVAGVAAALGAGVMALTGGITATTGLSTGPVTALCVTAAIVLAFIASSLSGLQKGIRLLSNFNARLFIAIALFIFVAGPTFAIIHLGAEGFVDYVADFIPASLTLGERDRHPWVQNWSVYFFANWLAWAPLTALFLGRIAVGYTVRDFIVFNLLLPATFGMIWMTILGGAAIDMNGQTGGLLVEAYENNGPEAVIYALFSTLPFAQILSVIFLLTVFISFVTAMDSNTLSISTLCLHDQSNAGEGAAFEGRIKIFWGLLIGSLSFIMTATTGIEGVRVLSNLGGAPGLVILIVSAAVLIKLMITFPNSNQKNSGN